MAYASETTLKRPVTIKGTGLHTGACVGVSLEPAPPRSGITFALGSERFTLREATVRSTELCVGIAKGKKEIKTVEHLLSAIFGIGLTNVVVRVQGPEIPILDGSALPFFEVLERAGLVRQPARKQVAVVLKPVVVTLGDRWVSLWPRVEDDPRTLRIEVEVDFARSAIGRQSLELDVAPGIYRQELAPARTFGFLEDVEAMRSKGLIKGASLANAVVLDADAGVLNPEGLRFPDEFVRHKALDIVGDLSLVGYPLVGRYVAFKPGHALNVMMIERLRTIQGAFVIQDQDQLRASADSPLLAAAIS